MTNIAGTNITAPIVPYSDTDPYPTHDDQYGKGGYRAVDNTTARDEIPAARRRAGMIVRTLDTNVNWILGADLTTWTAEVLDGGTF